MKIKLYCDFFCYSLWIISDDGGVENVSPESLKLSNKLKQKLKTWEEKYDSIFNEEYPPDSKFTTVEEKYQFIELGKEIYNELKKELPYANIQYIPIE